MLLIVSYFVRRIYIIRLLNFYLLRWYNLFDNLKLERDMAINVYLADICLRREMFVWRFLPWRKKNYERICLKFCASNEITAKKSLKNVSEICI